MHPPKIIIRPKGRLANNMFQLMLAIELKKRVPNAEIYGLSLPEWEIQLKNTEISLPSLTLQRHKFDLDLSAYMLKTGVLNSVIIQGWGMRLNNFPDIALYRKLFSTNERGVVLGDRQILINVRAEDIVSGKHRSYYPLPFSFYENVIDESGLEPVFMGQLDESDYVKRLKNKFSGAKYLPNASVISDFQTIRNAQHAAISVSSFAWLASWLSESLESIHFPVAGLFDPANMQTLMMPIDDPRYRFYDLRFPTIDDRKDISPLDWVVQPQPVALMSLQQAKRRMLSVFSSK